MEAGKNIVNLGVLFFAGVFILLKLKTNIFMTICGNFGGRRWREYSAVSIESDSSFLEI